MFSRDCWYHHQLITDTKIIVKYQLNLNHPEYLMCSYFGKKIKKIKHSHLQKVVDGNLLRQMFFLKQKSNAFSHSSHNLWPQAFVNLHHCAQVQLENSGSIVTIRADFQNYWLKCSSNGYVTLSCGVLDSPEAHSTLYL